MNYIAYGYHIDPSLGIVYGRRGLPIGAKSPSGYLTINHGRRGFYMLAHRVIWESVHGPIPDGIQINHINGIKTDNRIENLELVTPSENALHAYRIGLHRADGVHNGRHIGKVRQNTMAGVAV